MTKVSRPKVSQTFPVRLTLNVTFRANPVDMGELSPVYEWHFQKEGEEKEMMVRYEEDTEYTFMESGLHDCDPNR